MELAASLAELARDHGTALFRDPAAFRGALDDYLDEGTATSGTINLLTDAVRLGAVDSMLTMLDSGASPEAAVQSAGQRLARDRGSNDDRGCQWACAVIGFALSRVPEPLMRSLQPASGTGSVPGASPAPQGAPQQSPPAAWPPAPPAQSPPAQSPPAQFGAAPSGPPSGQQPGYGYPSASTPGGPAYGSWQTPPRKSRTGLIIAAAAVVLVLLVGGVIAIVVASSGGDDKNDAGPSKDTSSSATASSSDATSAAANGPVLHGTGYTVTMPQGWSDHTSAGHDTSGNLDKLVVNASTVEGSTANVAIAKSSSYSVSDPEHVRQDWERGLKSSDANAKVTDLPDRQIAGQKAIGASISRASGPNSELSQTAYLVIHNGTGYTIVFTCRKGDTEQDGVFDTFLAGWSWS